MKVYEEMSCLSLPCVFSDFYQMSVIVRLNVHVFNRH